MEIKYHISGNDKDGKKLQETLEYLMKNHSSIDVLGQKLELTKVEIGEDDFKKITLEYGQSIKIKMSYDPKNIKP